MDLQKIGKQKLFIAVAALIGFISTFLPWYSVSYDFGIYGSAGGSFGGTHFWYGIISLIVFLVTIAVCFVGDNIPQLQDAKNFQYAVAGAGGLCALLGFISIVDIGFAIGSILALLAGAAIVVFALFFDKIIKDDAGSAPPPSGPPSI
ncbi:MAG: hypothetical protein FWE80_05795 [Oscillospiraceae bacterium]|nr:hypothetical protein [Oscillospiraceae bacterium]